MAKMEAKDNASEREADVQVAIRLEYATLVWMALEFASSVVWVYSPGVFSFSLSDSTA